MSGPDLSRAKIRLAGPGGGEIIVDGEDIASKIDSIRINAAVGELPTLTVRYVCIEVEVDGEMRVEHRCPLKDDA